MEQGSQISLTLQCKSHFSSLIPIILLNDYKVSVNRECKIFKKCINHTYEKEFNLLFIHVA
jgi:hypothetical protein